MKYRTIIFLLLISVSMLFISCFDNPLDATDTEYTAADIANQPLQGEVEGDARQYPSGVAKTSEYDDNVLEIIIFDTDFSNSTICGYADSTERNSIQFNITAAVGEYPITFDFTGYNQTASIIDYSSGALQNFNCNEGIIVIDDIDANSVTLRMNIKYDSQTYANGECTLVRCN